MPFCPNCKVSLAPEAAFCPLCRARSVETAGELLMETAGREPCPDAAVSAPAPAAHTPVSWSDEIRDADADECLTPAQKRIVVLELLSVSVGIVLAVTVGVDILVSGGVSWSRYTSIALVEAYLCAAMPLVLWGHFWLAYAVIGPALAGGVFLWAVFTGDLSWFLIPALPIALVAEGAAVTAITLIRISRRKGLNAVGIVLAAIALLCTGIDASLGVFWHRAPVLSWSVVILIAVVPVAGFFFYLHYRLLRRASLRKLFRL